MITKIKAQIAKPDHPLWRKISNWIIILGGPMASFAIRFFVPEPYQEVANQILIALLAAIKAGSKLTEDPKLKIT
jgi:hypothetical protein